MADLGFQARNIGLGGNAFRAGIEIPLGNSLLLFLDIRCNQGHAIKFRLA